MTRPDSDLRVQLVMRRLRLGLTQRDLAARSGIPQSLISELEVGTRDYRMSTLHRWANSLGCDLVITAQPAGEQP